LEAGEDPNRYNPSGAHLDLNDTLFHSTPQDWAIHAGHTQVAGYLSAPGGTPPASHKVKPR